MREKREVQGLRSRAGEEEVLAEETEKAQVQERRKPRRGGCMEKGVIRYFQFCREVLLAEARGVTIGFGNVEVIIGLDTGGLSDIRVHGRQPKQFHSVSSGEGSPRPHLTASALPLSPPRVPGAQFENHRCNQPLCFTAHEAQVQKKQTRLAQGQAHS